eukprot:jgi/Psemu1/288847/fgenesh1_pg.293_\
MVHGEICTPMLGCLVLDVFDRDQAVGKDAVSEDIFGMVLDGKTLKMKDDRRENLWVKQSPERSKRRISKRYSRPIFKEPGSKVPKKTSRNIDDDRHFEETRWKRDMEIEKSSDLFIRVFGKGQSTYMFSSTAKDEERTKEGSCDSNNLERVVSRPLGRYNIGATNESIIIGTRLLQRMQKVRRQGERQQYVRDSGADSDCGSVVSVSDIDNLEEKTLRSNTSRKNLHSLREEIDVIVSSSLQKSEKSPSEKEERQECEKEERQEWTKSDGCVSDGCVSFLEDGGSGMQDFFNDMKAYWTI